MCVGSSIRGSSGLSTPLKGHESQMLGLPLLNSPNIRAITIRALGFAWAVINIYVFLEKDMVPICASLGGDLLSWSRPHGVEQEVCRGDGILANECLCVQLIRLDPHYERNCGKSEED